MLMISELITFNASKVLLNSTHALTNRCLQIREILILNVNKASDLLIVYI